MDNQGLSTGPSQEISSAISVVESLETQAGGVLRDLVALRDQLEFDLRAVHDLIDRVPTTQRPGSPLK